jgi:hypothetical protein
MRVLVAFLAVTLVGLALGANSALAGSKKPGASISVDLGPASVKVDASSGGADASVDVSTPAATVDATVDSSAQTPVSAAVDTSTPGAGATVDVGDSANAAVSTPVGSTAVRVDPQKGVKVSAHVKSPVAGGDAAVSARPAHVEVDAKVSGSAGTAGHTASAASSSPSPAAQVAAAAKPAAPKPVAHPAAHEQHVTAPRTIDTLVAAAPRNRAAAAQTGSTRQPGLTAVPAASRPIAGHPPATSASASAAAPTWHRPASAPGTGGANGASGSGISSAAFFVILTAFLMLVAPIVGRWLRPPVGLALRPAFASSLERPG